MKKEIKKNNIIKFGTGFALLSARVDILKEAGVEKRKAMKISYNFYTYAVEIGQELGKKSKTHLPDEDCDKSCTHN